MVEPTSDHAEGITEEEAPRCDTCGGAIVESPTHRVRSWIEEGRVQTVHFCDDACLRDWDGDTEAE